MKVFLISAAAIALAAAPASAQLLGGSGGLGGSLGGTLGGTLGGAGSGSLGSTIGGTGSRIGGMSSGTIDGRGRTSGSQHVDRKSGTVSVDRTANGALGGTAGQALDTPHHHPSSASGSGSASGNANANGSAQFVGTDAVRGTLSSTRSVLGSTARDGGAAASSAVGETRGFADGARNGAAHGVATARGAFDASTANAVSAAHSQLAIAGSAAANAAGAFAVEPGMVVESAKGKTIGTVHDVVTDSSGQVRAVIVESKDRLATLPAGNFSGSGDVLVTGLSQAEITKASESQAKESDTPAS